MRQEDGYCDECGCECPYPQLTVEGLAVCEACQVIENAAIRRAKRPEARDDGRQ